MNGILNQNSSYFGFGTSQNLRSLKALLPEYVQFDDRRLSDLLAFSYDLSKFVSFYNLHNKKEGNWENFFSSDISIILASIISLDLKRIEYEFNALIDRFYREQDHEKRRRIFEDTYVFIHDCIQLYDTWFLNIKGLFLKNRHFEQLIENELYNIIQDKVQYSAHQMYAYNLAASTKEGLGYSIENNFDKFHTIWDFDEVEPKNIFFGKETIEKITSAMLQLRLIFRSVYQSLHYTSAQFTKYFERSINEKSDHKPDIALFIAFLQLYGHHQNELNNISARLINYYYRNYLKLKPRIPTPDQVVIHFLLNEHIDRLQLEKGTLLNAGVDKKGEEIFFQTVRDTELTQAKIENFKTIYLSRIDDLDSSHYRIVSHIYSANVANSIDGKGAPFEKEFQEWPLFGEEQEYKPYDQVNMSNSTIGLAIASPIFHLSEGNREITVTFHFVKESTRILKRLIYDVHKKVNANKDPDEPKNTLEDTFYQRIFNQVDNTRNIDLYLTGRKGWVEVDPNTLNIKAVGEGDWSYDEEISAEDCMPVLNSLRFRFSLPVSKPPIVAYDPEVYLEEFFDTYYPVMKFILNDNKQPFSYSFLQSLQINSIELGVKVDRVKRFDVYDDLGQRFPNKGFYPFGPGPTDGSQALFAIPELFKKNLTDVKFNVQWDSMPRTVGDFKNHYSNYKEPPHPADFRVRIGALSNYEIITDYDESLEFFMFSSIEGDHDAKDHLELEESEFHLTEDALYNLNIDPDYDLGEEIVYDADTETGLFVWELFEPRFGFGNAVFQNELNEAISRNSEDPTANPKFPREPIIPYIKNMVISYEAKSIVNVTYGDQFAPEEIFHIHPFGIEKTYYQGSPEKDTLLPRYTEDGYLFIGLRNIQAPESLSIHFELSSKKTKIQNLHNVPEIKWKYLSYNTWRELDESKILLDSTEGFTQSGIVQLQIPMAITDQNDILDDGLFWICASVSGNTELLCEAIAINEQAVEAEWVIPEDFSGRDTLEPIPPNTINSLVNQTSEINTISQPFESYGGKREEDQEEFFYRVAERLKHKGRAVTHWDFERIVLDKFSNVQQVKCISFLSNPLDEKVVTSIEEYFNIEEEKEDITGIKHSEGIKIVTIPKLKKHLKNNTPKFSLSKLLQMERFLNSIVPPFTKLQVVNPQYEYVRIIANVKFIDGMNNGLTLSKMKRAIDEYISPWLFNEEKEIQIGGRLNENVLQNYIKALPYVKFLTKFSILHVIEEGGIFKLQDTAAEQDVVSIIKARPWGVLLPDDNHEIEMIEYEEEEVPKSRVNTDEIIRFQNKVNILGDKKYIKIKNTNIITEEAEEVQKENYYTVSIKL